MIRFDRPVSPLVSHAGGWLGGASLVLLCVAAYLPGLASLPPIDGDEARYAEAAREMATAHDFKALIIPHIQEAPRLNKPPLVYWLQAASAYLLTGGHVSHLSFPSALVGEADSRTITGSPPTREELFTGGIWLYRLPAVLATILAVLITWRLGLQMYAPPCAWLAAALLGGCFLVMLDARLARTDQILLLWTCAAQWALWNIWRDRTVALRWAILFWVAVGLGIMTKGPVTPGVAALTILALLAVTGDSSWLPRMRWGLGALILGVILIPWPALAIGTIGWKPMWSAVTQELIERGVAAKGGRGGPPGYHLVLLPGLFWPGGLLVVPAFLYALRRGLRRRPAVSSSASGPIAARVARGWRGGLGLRAGRSAELFCLAWIVPAWIVCELVGTKLPHYTLPLYPPIALLCARAAWAGAAGTLPLMRAKAAVVGDLIWLLLGFALTVGLPIYLARAGGLRAEFGSLTALIASSVLVSILLIAAWTMVRQQRYVATLLIGLGATFVSSRGLFQTVLPNIRAPWLSSEVVRELATLDPDGSRPVAAAGYYLESLLFLTGGSTDRIDASQVDEWLARHPNGLVIAVNGAYRAEHPVRVVASISGFNYVEGRSTTLDILEQPAPGGLTQLHADGRRSPETLRGAPPRTPHDPLPARAAP